MYKRHEFALTRSQGREKEEREELLLIQQLRASPHHDVTRGNPIGGDGGKVHLRHVRGSAVFLGLAQLIIPVG